MNRKIEKQTAIFTVNISFQNHPRNTPIINKLILLRQSFSVSIFQKDSGFALRKWGVCGIVN